MSEVGVRNGCNRGVNASVMSHWGGDHGWGAMACGLGQHLLTVGLGLKVVGSIEDSDLMAVMVPISVVGMPVKSLNVNGAISLNQLLFHKIAPIELGIAKLVMGEIGELEVREGAEYVRERFLGKLDEGPDIINARGREQIDGGGVQMMVAVSKLAPCGFCRM